MIKIVKKKDLTRLFVTIWAIWHAKRKVIHEEIYQSPPATMAFVNRFLGDLGDSKEKVGMVGGKARAKTTKRWIAPPHRRTKINVDAEVAKSIPKRVVGVVSRSPEGVYVRASAVVFDGITHP
jgi:hypothetical protein